MEIKIGIGIGDVKFGMDRAQVESIMGKADNVSEMNYDNTGEDKAIIWQYERLDIDFTFDQSDDWKMGAIMIESNRHKLGHTIRVGIEKDKLIRELTKLGIDDLVIEPMPYGENPNYELIESDKMQTNFWLNDGEVSQIQFSPLWQDEDNIIWPELD